MLVLVLVLVGGCADPVHGVPPEKVREAARLCGRFKGMTTGPVHEGEAMQGMIDLVRTGGGTPRGARLRGAGSRAPS